MDGDAGQIGTAVDILRQRFGDRLTTNDTIRERHGTDRSYHAPKAPDAVVFPQTREEVQEIVRICAEHRTPIIPFGVGTSLEGHIAALQGGVSIDLGQMNSVLRVNAADLDVTVEAGVTRKQLNEHLRDTGLFFPIDPGADATIGGMSATRASGTNAVRYGTMRENVLSLGVVLPDGKYIRTGKRARKSSAGYDLTRMFVGSEGTLGVITDITLRLYGIPEMISSAICTYPTVDDAVNTVILTIQSGVPIARIELIDEVQMQALNKFAGLGYAERPTLFFEFHGTEAGVAEQIESVKTISDDFGGADSPGPARRRIARSYGRRGTTRITPICSYARVRRRGLPTSAYLYPASPNALRRRGRTSKNPACSHLLSAMSATAIFMSTWCWTPMTGTKLPGPWR